MKTITAAELDEKFDNGEDISEYLDWDNATRSLPNLELQPVDLDLPVWAIDGLDAEAERLGVTRQALIQSWISERLEAARQNR